MAALPIDRVKNGTKNWASRLAAAPWPARWAVPLSLGAMMALGHEPSLQALPVLFGLILACLFLPQRPRSASWFGWLLGIGYFAVALRWIVEPFLVDVARHGWMAPFAIALMAGGLGLFWALAAGAGPLGRRSHPCRVSLVCRSVDGIGIGAWACVHGVSLGVALLCFCGHAL